MRTLVTAAALALAAAAGAAYAQGAPSDAAGAPQPQPLPRVFVAAGYAQHDITPGLCRNISPQETQCVIPQMTAGTYLIQASGTSTATGDGAVQALNILLGNAPCTQGRSNNTGKDSKPWTSGPQTIRLGCVVQILTDNTLTIRTTYDDAHATKDPKGPTLSIRALGWNPYLQAVAAGGATEQPKPGQ
jgi:hypothetical protein